MEVLSRVVKYQDLRRKIENMELYSYYDNDLESQTNQKSAENIRLFDCEHIKKNTLSIPLSELIKRNKDKENNHLNLSDAQKQSMFSNSKGIKREVKLTRNQILYIVLGVMLILVLALVITIICIVI